MTDSFADSGAAQLLDPESYAQYALHDPREIAQLVHTLASRHLLITAFIDRGPSFLTAVVGVSADGQSLLLDAGPDEALNALATTATELVCMTRLDKVTIQFALPRVARVIHAGRPALQAPVPASVLRLQRREYFRVATPQSDPLICNITHRMPNGREQVVAVRILDLSGGGLAIVVPPAEIAFDAGSEFERCALMLPDGDPLPVRLRVRNLFALKKPSGVRVHRAGCEFVGLSNAAAARIQRYLFKLERDRRTRDPQ